MKKLKQEVVEIVNLTEAEAKKWLIENGLKPRVMTRDKEHFAGTCDYRTDRVNLNIQKDRVVECWEG
jgi:hypothetical protein